MAFFCALYRRSQIPSFAIHFHQDTTSFCSSLLLQPTFRSHFFSDRGGSATAADFPEYNAYRILGVSETSSFSQIKASFRQLAKQTHPDLLQSSSDPSASKRFVQILASYEILSDSKKRAHYDSYLLSQRKLVQKHVGQGSLLHTVESYYTTNKEMEVVEWLKWYRLTVNDIVSNRRVVVGSGYFDVLEADFYSAVHAAYYGPSIESDDLLPDRFEAEERSVYETPEVLHLVSGRSLFGMVCLGKKCPELSSPEKEKLTSFRSNDHALCQSFDNASSYVGSNVEKDAMSSKFQGTESNDLVSDAYKHLELHVSGKLVAIASRIPPKSTCKGIKNQDADDHIHIFLNSFDDPVENVDNHPEVAFSDRQSETRCPLARIVGLGTSPQEGSCFVYNSIGEKTHVIMKHRTYLVKHMHWYRIGEEMSVCECRCSRARLPPSKFWLFEPRCGMHDIGGWYIETYGRDKKGRTVASQRYWDGLDTVENLEERLHPSVYLLALAYRTLDIEDARRRKGTIRSIVEGNLSRMLDWWRKII